MPWPPGPNEEPACGGSYRITSARSNAWFAKDKQQGHIDRHLQPRTASMMFLGMIVPAGVIWHLSDGGFNLTQHAGRAWKMFQQALTCRNGTPCR